MRLDNDDRLWAVDNRWLGPRGYPFPWRARYSAYGLGLIVWLVILMVFHHVGVGFGIAPAVVSIVLAVGVTTVLHRRVDAERPVRCIAETLWSEVGAPRDPKPVMAQMAVPPLREMDAKRPDWRRR